MKHRIKTAFAIAMLLTATLPLASCQKQTLAVKSLDYPEITELTSAKPDFSRIHEWYYNTNPYWYNDCFLKLSDENELIIYSDEPQYNTHLYYGDLNYFVGVNIGEHEGWVMMYPYNHLVLQSDYYESIVGHPVEVEVEVVAEENCLGFIKIDNRNAYLITAEIFGHITNEDGSKVYNRIYKLYLDLNDGKWKWDIIGSTKKYLGAYFYDNESNDIYIADIDEITCFDLETYEFTTIAKTPHVHRAPRSLVKMDSKLYLCWSMGIYEYDLDTNSSLWYPIPHEKYGTKEEKAKYKEHTDKIELKKLYGATYSCEDKDHYEWAH